MASNLEFNYRSISTDAVELDAENPRQTDDQVEFDQLCASIEAHGIEVPIVVREVAPGRYRVIDGHRRLLCARKLALPEVECRIFVSKTPGDVELLRYRLNNRW